MCKKISAGLSISSKAIILLASPTVNVSFLTLDISVDSAIPSFLAKSCCDIPHLAKAALYRFLLIFAPSLPVTYQVTLLYSLMCNLSSVFQKNFCIFASTMLKWVRGDENDIRGENTPPWDGSGGHKNSARLQPCGIKGKEREMRNLFLLLYHKIIKGATKWQSKKTEDTVQK